MTGRTLADDLEGRYCSHCSWPFNVDSDDEWSLTFSDGVVVAITCTGCMTATQHLHGSVNAAMYDLTLDESGRAYMTPPKEGPEDATRE